MADRKPAARERADYVRRVWNGGSEADWTRIEREIIAAERAAREDALREPTEEEREAAWEGWCKYDNDHRDHVTARPLQGYSGREAIAAALTTFLEGRRRG